MSVEIIVIIVLLIVSVYIVWKITKALVQAIIFTIILGVGAYFGAAYVLGDDQEGALNDLTERGAALVDDTIEGAKDLTKEKVLEPLKETVKPVHDLDEALNEQKGQKKRGVK